MHKLSNRKLKGGWPCHNGYILDNADPDPTVQILHHVWCMENRSVVKLTRQTYDETVREIASLNRKNDRHRLVDAAFKIGDYIVFTVKKEGNSTLVVDFEHGENPNNLLFENGKNVFLSQCVFNAGLNRVFTEHFEHFDVDPEYIRNMKSVPTPNVVYKCHIAYRLDSDLNMNPTIVSVVDIDADSQEFAQKAAWNSSGGARYDYGNDSDDDVLLEVNEAAKLGAIPGQKGIITGLTSLFVPEMPSKTILLHDHNLRQHYIGHETQCDLVRNDILNCYVVFQNQPSISTHYHTMISRSKWDVEGVFYVDINVTDSVHGFYKHKQFKLIADPYSHLDVVRLASEEDSTLPHIYTVPIRDRLGKLHDSRSISDLKIITRFEIVGPGDKPNQVEKVEKLSQTPLTVGNAFGLVLNAKENRVFGFRCDDDRAATRNFHGIAFKLNRNHHYQTGEIFHFQAQRKCSSDIGLPTLEVLTTRPEVSEECPNVFCNYEKGWFELEVTYRELEDCYESNAFGFIPCKKPPPKKREAGKNKNRQHQPLYRIRARENINCPGQTVFCDGEYVKDVNV